MESTVQLDKKLIVDTLAHPNKSSVGLMMIPPPMPQTAPTVDARKLTKKDKQDCPIVIEVFPSCVGEVCFAIVLSQAVELPAGGPLSFGDKIQPWGGIGEECLESRTKIIGFLSVRLGDPIALTAAKTKTFPGASGTRRWAFPSILKESQGLGAMGKFFQSMAGQIT